MCRFHVTAAGSCIAPQACTAACHMIARRKCQCLPRRRVAGQLHPGGWPLRCAAAAARRGQAAAGSTSRQDSNAASRCSIPLYVWWGANQTECKLLAAQQGAVARSSRGLGALPYQHAAAGRPLHLQPACTAAQRLQPLPCVASTLTCRQDGLQHAIKWQTVGR